LTSSALGGVVDNLSCTGVLGGKERHGRVVVGRTNVGRTSVSRSVAREYSAFVDAARQSDRLPPPPDRLASGQVTNSVFVRADEARELLQVAARRAAGLYRPTKRTEVVWVEGDSELAVGLADVDIETADGLVRVTIPIRCDQSGSAAVEVNFAMGAPDAPAGLFASTFRRPTGPQLVIDTWGDALVAFAWQCVLGMVAGLSAAVGKDSRGNVLVPSELVSTKDGLQIVPMARHRFSGSSGLTSTNRKRRS